VSDKTNTEDASGEAPRISPSVWLKVGSYGIIALFVIMVIAFSIAKPSHFPTFTNAKAILLQASIFAVLGAGLTVVLVIGEFDLSFDNNTALSGAVAVAVMANLHLPMAVGLLAGLATGALVGVANGTLIAFGRAPAFISTLAVSSVAAGLQAWLTNDQTTYGVPNSYVGISTASILGIPLFIWVSVIVIILVGVLLTRTVYGRHAHAVGSNVVAAESAGIRTREVRWTAFVVMGALAGLAGVLLTAQDGGSAPTDSAGLLLPTYTAVFLGASALGRGRFNASGTYFGVVFIGTLSTGLTFLQQPAWVASVATGAVLVVAVLLRRKR
jgi:ribose transport system permease protein